MRPADPPRYPAINCHYHGEPAGQLGIRFHNVKMDIEASIKIKASLDGLEARRKKLLKLGKAMMKAYEGAMYPVDLLATGMLKRTISTIAGFKLLVKSLNMVCARTILRTHIDSALRFFSVFLVNDPHAYSLKVLGGEQINRIKDANGKLMRDAYLVNKLSEEYPWLPNVYSNLSGYIHFSDSHIFSSVEEVDSNDHSIKFAIHEEDTKFPEFSWLEVIDCFNETIDISIKYLEGWIFTKDNPEIVQQLKEKRKANKCIERD